jgi:Forkhead domain
MSRLDTILNPQDDDIPTPRFERLYCVTVLILPHAILCDFPCFNRTEHVPTPPLRLSPSSPTSSSSETSRTSHHAQGHQETKEHCAHPTCPDALRCLPDTDGRPQHTLPVILRCAILGSKMKRLTIREIYAAMEEKYPYYRTAGSTWKVRFFSCPTCGTSTY